MKSFLQFLLESPGNKERIFVPSGANQTPLRPFFQQQTSQLRSMSDMARQILDDYVAGGNYHLNYYLRKLAREGKISDPTYPEGWLTSIKTKVSEMDDLIRQQSITSENPMTVWRWVPGESATPGVQQGYLSTSVNPRWAAAATRGHKGARLLRIDVPAGTPYLPVDSMFPDENELLFGRGHNLEIDPKPSKMQVAFQNNKTLRPIEVLRARLSPTTTPTEIPSLPKPSSSSPTRPLTQQRMDPNWGMLIDPEWAPIDNPLISKELPKNPRPTVELPKIPNTIKPRSGFFSNLLKSGLRAGLRALPGLVGGAFEALPLIQGPLETALYYPPVAAEQLGQRVQQPDETYLRQMLAKPENLPEPKQTPGQEAARDFLTPPNLPIPRRL